MFEIQECRETYGDILKSIKSDLHMHPEVSMQEYRTTGYIRNWLMNIGIEILELGLETGVIGLLRGASPGPLIALRADIDALPVTEYTGDEDSSLEAGKMHACGHDVHTAGLLGAAMLLKRCQDRMRGSVVFVFQPAEETIEGAGLVIESGLFEQMKIHAMFGLHVRPDIQIGHVGVRAGALMSAKDSFSIRIQGTGGHASMPQDTADPIVAGAAVVSALQSIVSRNVKPQEAIVLSVCSIHAGTADNIVPDELTMLGSMRSCSEHAREVAMARIAEIAGGVAGAYGCSARTEFLSHVPILVNDPALTEIAWHSAMAAFGEGNIVEPGIEMLSEDFAEYAKRTPIFFYYLGVGTQGREYRALHNPAFHADEQAPVAAAVLLAQSAWHAQDELA